MAQEPTAQIYPYRFRFEDENLWREYLKENGFVVIANWLNDQSCQKYVDDFWEIMEYLSDGKLDRNDASTQVLGKNYPPVLHGGMIQYVGHSQPQWELREKCRPIFQKLWDREDVRTSFDGFCFMNGRRNYQKTQNDSFLHCDQSPTKNFVWSYQGIMCLTDADEQGGGFVAVPKSHLYHRDYFRSKGLLTLKDNWFVVPEKDKQQGILSQSLKVNNKAGDFILFDSRTFHCNTKPKIQALRICTYICMLPSQKIPKKFEEARKKALKERRTSNHHAGDGFKMFPVIPRYLEDPKKFKRMLQKVNETEVEKNKDFMSLV